MAIAPGFVVSEMTEALIDTPEHAKWQGWVINAFKNNVGYPPELSGKAILELVKIASPELTGRLFHVNQDFSKVDRAKAGIKEHDLLTMRFVEDADVLDRIDWSQG
jgi:hypothetical protein